MDKEELKLRHKIKARLIKLAPTDDKGRKLCPQCLKLPDFRGLELCHEKALSQGGKTTFRNCFISCSPCHHGEYGHRTENIPRGKPVDKCGLSGYHGLRPFPKEAQTGLKGVVR